MNPQAKELNDLIEQGSPVVYSMLSERGKNIFFPKKGILGQTADAKGKKINATIGAAVEDDNSPMRLNSIEKQLNVTPAQAFPYAPSFGRPDIRGRWKEMLYEKNPSLSNVELSTPVVTNALTHALSMVGYMFLEADDKVLVSDLFWGNYNLTFTQAYGSEIVKFKLFKENGFDIESFKSAVAALPKEKKVVLLNFPNNPSGYTPTEAEIDAIVEVLKAEAESGSKLVVVTDDAYFGLVYEEGILTESIFARIADIHENIVAVKVDGPTKEDYVWGFRVGFITYNTKGGKAEMYDALAAKTAGAIRGNISNACNLSQSLLLNAYNDAEYEAEKKAKFDLMKARYDEVNNVLQDKKYAECFTPYPFNSGYFMCVQLKEGLDGEAIRRIMLDKYSTGIINLNNVFRVAFSGVRVVDVKELFDNMYNACKDFENQ